MQTHGTGEAKGPGPFKIHFHLGGGVTRYLNLMRNISNWSLYPGIKFGLTRPDTIYFTTRSGVVMEVLRRLLQTFREVFMDECYMGALQRGFPKRGTVIGAWANAGFFSRFAASRFGQLRIFSYEPIPVNFQQLEKNRQLNPKHDMDSLEPFFKHHGFRTQRRPVDMLWAWKPN